ncbi:hypothetical protein HW555_013984 [Spodoptera exigua]|uniref:Zinc finger protein on ecdysone puffs n=1 Tax=Spodoptera exigua TaxID=7107 RepID=A0A835G400_SPOEX|nr:hypothetical protein HW555_013984 [Spodoptera exigua]
MANRRPQSNSGRRMDFQRNDRGKNFGRSGVSPWQGSGPGGGMPNLLPLSGGSTEATLALANNIINLLQPRQNPVPSLLDMPIRRDFGPNVGRYDRGYGPTRMGNQGNFRRTGTYNRSGERVNNNRKPYRPNDGQRQQNKSSPKKEADSKAKPVKESKPPAVKQKRRMMLLQLNKIRRRIREMKRTRKAGQQPARDFYCAMCDMYAADGAIHRTTVGHRKLKKYLHPTCTSCHKEMPTRIELDEHRLTAEHLRNMQDKQEIITKPKPEVMVISTLNMEQMYLREDRQRRRRNDDKNGTDKDGDDAEAKDGEGENQDEVKNEAEGEAKPEGDAEEKKSKLDNEKTILDYKEGDDLTGATQDMFPAYSTERGVGGSFLSEFRCVQCSLCRKLLDTDETAQVHLRTWRHHQLFTRLLAEKSGTQLGNDTNSNKRPLDADDNSDAKRRKVDDETEQNGHENGEENKEDELLDSAAEDSILNKEW